MKLINGIILFYFLFMGNVYSAFNPELMNSASSAGMGGAFIGIADDSSAVAVNSAGIAQIKSPEISAGYSKLYAGLDYSSIGRFFISGCYPVLKIVNLGIYINRLYVDNYSENSIIFSASRNFFGSFCLGMSYKFYYWNTAPIRLYNTGSTEEILNGGAFSFDLSALFKFENDIIIGVVLADINRPDISSDVSVDIETIPFSLKIGGSYKLKNCQVAADFILRNFEFSPDTPLNNEIYKKIGCEYYLKNYNLTLRTGLSFFDIFTGFNFSLGAGYDFSAYYNVKFDYAFILPVGSIKSTLGSHYITVGYKF